MVVKAESFFERDLVRGQERRPACLMLHHGVQNNEQFVHASGDRYFEGFAGLPQALIERANDGIEAGGGQGRHIQGIADLFPSAPNATFPFQFAAVTIERSDTHQRRNRFAIQDAQFGKIAEQRR